MPTLGIGPEWLDDGSKSGNRWMAQILEGYDTIRSSRGYPRALNDDAPEHCRL